jgi:hypothetical protein
VEAGAGTVVAVGSGALVASATGAVVGCSTTAVAGSGAVVAVAAGAQALKTNTASSTNVKTLYNLFIVSFSLFKICMDIYTGTHKKIVSAPPG